SNKHTISTARLHIAAASVLDHASTVEGETPCQPAKSCRSTMHATDALAVSLYAMDHDWGRARALELLSLATSSLEEELRAGRWHTLFARYVGGLSILTDDARSREIAQRILADAPDKAFWDGVITNVDRQRLVHRAFPSDREIEDRFPVYGAAVL